MKNLSRSPLIWISATVLSGILYFGAFKFFPQAFPIVHLDISMDLEQALEQADSIAKQYSIGPSEYHNAATFHTDHGVKTFVELEAGGKDALVSMMDDKFYMPYTWQVRHFKEHEKHESLIIFTPDGKPYSFVETISENLPGAQLSEKDARKIAEHDAAENWNIDFTQYALVEASQKTEISKRIDHTFVYERTDKKIGEGLYRLKIVVSGDKTTTVLNFVKVPEAFTRRYAEMRSANTTLSFAATLVMQFLYLIAGCCVGLYWLFRKQLVIIKQPIMWALFLAAAATGASINQLPLWWMQYNSAHSINGFIMNLCLTFFMMFIGQAVLLTLIIAAAEGLTRRAFATHPQLWSLWSSEQSTSYAVLGRTIGGYLLVGFNLAFVIGFYLFSLNHLGWWSPSEMLFDPNILATYVPWFSPLAQSINAGFMEECLFRAIPLAGAALIGTYYGKRNIFIAVALIVQAVIFGAAHANYPMQPSYARLIELFIPSLIWGITYLRFGLLPTIIAHFVYDVIWFSVPIFIAHTSDVISYKVIIILMTLLPLIYVLYARLRKGTWNDLAQSAYNNAWQPITPSEQHSARSDIQESSYTTDIRKHTKTIVILGILGLAAWIYTTRFTHDGVTITLNRTDAVTVSNNFLQTKNFVPSAPWRTLPLVFTHYKLVPHIALQHKFIWKKGKKELYQQLLGTYLQPAHWTIRYAQFDTDLIQRAEEHRVIFYNENILRHYHQLPEISAGAALSQEQARTIAHATLQKQFNLDPAQITEISAVQTQLPQRINWLFIFSDGTVYPLSTGQARISILIAGDEVIDTARAIYVPEEWARKEQDKQNILSIIAQIFSLILVFFSLWGAVLVSRQKTMFAFSKRLFYLLFTGTMILMVISMINMRSNAFGMFDTSLPLYNQLFQWIAGLIFGGLLGSAVYAFFMSYVLSYKTPAMPISQNTGTIMTGICSGFLIAGALNCARTLILFNLPLWPQYEALCSTIPLIASSTDAITQFINATTVFSLLFIFFDSATAQWQKNRILFTIIAALFGMSLLSLPSLKMLPLWIVIGSMMGLILLTLYRYVIRHNYALIPLATGSSVILKFIQQGIFNAYPGAAFAAVLQVCAVGICAGMWYWYTSKQE